MTVIINGSSGITNVNGTAAAPAETGTDTDSGIVYGTNTVSLATNGTTALTVNSSQNVGIGTTSPAAKLDVRGSSTFLVNATNPTAWVSVDSALTTGSIYNQWNTTSSIGISGTYTNHPYTFVTNNTERMRIDTSGNVGIGTSSPAVKLHVSGGTQRIQSTGSTSDAFLTLQNDVGTQAILGIISSGNSPANTFFIETNAGKTVYVTSAGLFQFNNGYGSTATAYGCRAWVNFNGTGTVAIRASGNVTSITDNGVGDYTVNFTNAMPDANYSSNYSIGELNTNYWGPIPYIYAQTTTSCRVRSVFATGSFYDQNSCNFSVFR